MAAGTRWRFAKPRPPNAQSDPKRECRRICPGYNLRPGLDSLRRTSARSILTVITTAPRIEGEALLLVVYAVGAAVPMMAIAYGGQFVTTRVRSIARVSHRLQQGFGAVIIVFAAAMYLQYDTLITAWFSEFYPNGQVGL